MIDRDRHLTPLSALDKTAVSGTFIHAQALAQRFDGNRDIRELPDWIVVISAWLISLTCFYAARIVGFYPSSLLYGIIGAGLIGIMSFAAYAKFHIDFPSIALTTAWAAGGFGGFLSDRVFRWLGINSISNPKARSV